jgi:hypothetical protein
VRTFWNVMASHAAKLSASNGVTLDDCLARVEADLQARVLRKPALGEERGGHSQSGHRNPDSGGNRSAKNNPPAKPPKIPDKFRKPLQHLPAFQALKITEGSRWTIAGFCAWLRTEKGLSISEMEFSTWWPSYMRAKRRVAGSH